MKSKEILELEQQLGFELTETKDMKEIISCNERGIFLYVNTKNVYLLSEKKEFIGLNLQSNGFLNISFFNKAKNYLSLTHLSLAYNRPLDIQPLKKLIYLTHLHLESNEISDISPLVNLMRLTHLQIGFGNISDLLTLKHLTNLTHLNLRENEIIDITPLNNLTKLVTLYLQMNKISEVGALSRLIDLKFLHLWSNEISNITPLGSLVNLHELVLADNQISDVKPLSSLKNLTYLVLMENQITNISLEFLNSFPKLETLFLASNPIENIREEIFDRERYSKGENVNVLKPVRAYLEGIEKGSQINNEVKVLLIGNGSVGKTHVAKRLAQGNEFVFNTSHDSTHAISLLSKNITCDFSETGLNLSIWDFGGQDIYHTTHRLFMKTRAIFLLVWDIESEVNDYHEVENSTGELIRFKNEKLNYWLSYATYFGKNSPIIVVQNKIDEFEKLKELAPPYNELAQNELKKAFPIVDFVQVSAKNGIGMHVLENAITEAFESNEELQKDLRLPLPLSWVLVRDRIREEQQNPNGKKQLPYEEFVVWCKEENIENEADTLAVFFHDTGVFYYQENYFSGEIIINQSWAIEAVYKVLDKANDYYELLQQKKGVLDYKIIKKAWSDNTDEERELFISYMLSTELCFESTSNKLYNCSLQERTFLIPQFLPPKNESEISDYVDLFDLKQYQKVTYSFLPTSIIQRFIIKAKRFSSVETMWQTGLFIEYGEAKVIVEAIYETNNNHVCIYYNLEAQNELVEAILDELEKLDNENSSRKLDKHKMILGEKTLKRGFEKLKIIQYLSTPHTTTSLKDNKKSSMQTIKIFLASSSELKEDRRELREFFSVENDRMHEKGIYFKLIQWEYFLDTISDTRLQDDYNRALQNCDLVVSLFFTKAGKYTAEELEKAYQHFKATGSPNILTYFKDTPVNMNNITEEVLSLLAMKKNLADKGHFYTSYPNTDWLKNHIKSQLEKLGYYDNQK